MKGRYNQPPDRSNKSEFDLPTFEPYGEGYAEATPRGVAPAPLDVLGIDMCMIENKRLHRTEDYDNDLLIIRRGQQFYLRVQFTRPIDQQLDDYQLEFRIGSYPWSDRGALNQVVFGPRAADSVWAGEVMVTTEESPNTVTLGIIPPADAIVGKYSMFVAIPTQPGIERTRRDPTKDFYLLFNAWCPDDQVYLDDEQKRHGYVIEDDGTIYQGDPQSVTQRPWNYGQFDKDVLDACIYILDESEMPLVNRASPIFLVRRASAMLNSQDDDGVLVGNWSDDYSLGTAPTLWTGSVQILVDYYKAEGVPISFAQCWVFAAVLNTMLRCLGIPSRVVTNFSSAHDNTGNLKTDLIFHSDGSPDKERTKDSIWNYHCWNEAWMLRPDLGSELGLGGWQAVDATPQETSDGYYRCGPASVKAIKDGMVGHAYDAAFVFAEVNSDLIFRQVDKYGLYKTTYVNKTHVGNLILTKHVGLDLPHDITDTYKYREGCEEDVLTMRRAEEYGLMREVPEFLDAVNKMSVTIHCDKVPVGMGEGFTLNLNFKNEGTREITTKFSLIGYVIFYTGVPTEQFKDHRGNVTVEAGETYGEDVFIRPRDYMHALGSESNLQFIVTGGEGGEALSDIKVIALHAPPLSITFSGVNKVGYDMSVILRFTNPMDYPLTRVYMAMEGPRLMSYRTKYYDDLAPNATLTWTESFSPRVVGDRRMMAALVADNLKQVWGSALVEILS